MGKRALALLTVLLSFCILSVFVSCSNEKTAKTMASINDGADSTKESDITDATGDKPGESSRNDNTENSEKTDSSDDAGEEDNSGTLENEKGLAFKLNTEGSFYTVTGIGDCEESELVIPSEYKGLIVKSIGSGAFNGNTQIISVVIPDSVSSIGKDAFKQCVNLKGVYITNIRAWCEMEFDGTYSNPLYYAKSLYLNDELVTELVIPEGTVGINKRAFYGCESIKKVSMPNSVEIIDSYAFAYCKELEEVDMSCFVTSIGENAFNACTLLESIRLPNTLTSIGHRAFHQCYSLFGNKYDNGLYLGNEENPYLILIRVMNNGVSSCKINEQTRFIHSDAFNGCSEISKIVIPKTVECVMYGAFKNCTSLTIYCEAIRLPSGWDSNWNSDNCPVVWDYKAGA